MRYSIESAQPPPLLGEIAGELLYGRSEEGKLVLVEPVAGRVRLSEWRGGEMEQPASRVEVENEAEVEWGRAVGVWCCEEEWVILLQAPVQLYVVVSKYSKMLEVQLEEKYDLEQVVPYLAYPQLFIYGHDATAKQSRLLNLHLHTYQVKPNETVDTKHTPQHFSRYWAHASQQRFYLTGQPTEQLAQQQAAESLFWTYNIENGNWFALGLSPPEAVLPTQYINCEVENGKVVVCSPQGLLLVELYQSRVHRLQIPQQARKVIDLSKGQALFSIDGGACLILSNGQRFNFRLLKHKSPPAAK